MRLSKEQLRKLARKACAGCANYEEHNGDSICFDMLKVLDITHIILCKDARERLGMFNARITKQDLDIHIQSVIDMELFVKTEEDLKKHQEYYGPSIIHKMMPENQVMCDSCLFFGIVNGKRRCLRDDNAVVELDDCPYKCGDFLHRKVLEE